jgi:hypothetical protein
MLRYLRIASYVALALVALLWIRSQFRVDDVCFGVSPHASLELTSLQGIVSVSYWHFPGIWRFLSGPLDQLAMRVDSTLFLIKFQSMPARFVVTMPYWLLFLLTAFAATARFIPWSRLPIFRRRRAETVPDSA